MQACVCDSPCDGERARGCCACARARERRRAGSRRSERRARVSPAESSGSASARDSIACRTGSSTYSSSEARPPRLEPAPLSPPPPPSHHPACAHQLPHRHSHFYSRATRATATPVARLARLVQACRGSSSSRFEEGRATLHPARAVYWVLSDSSRATTTRWRCVLVLLAPPRPPAPHSSPHSLLSPPSPPLSRPTNERRS